MKTTILAGPTELHYSNGKPFGQSLNPMYDGLGVALALRIGEAGPGKGTSY